MPIGSTSVSLLRGGPVIDYTSLDFASIKQDLITYAQANYSDRWTDFNIDQFGVVFLDQLAYIGDLLTYYLNATARELCAVTAQRRQSFARIAKSYDYHLKSAGGSSGDLTLITDQTKLPITISTAFQVASGSTVFQPDQEYVLTAANGTNNGDGTYSHDITVVQGEPFVNVSLGISDGSREQVYSLPNTPLIDGTLTVMVNGTPWTAVTSFTASEPSSTHYRIETDDDGDTYVFFGDNINGKAPPSTQDITATWKTGGGRSTNVAARTVTSIITPIVGVISCTNVLHFDGGTNQETLAAARSALPKSIAASNRAVTVDDYATLAFQSSSSVAKAKAKTTPDFSIEISVAPGGGGQPSDALLSEVAAYVNARRLVNRRIRTTGAIYVPCSVALDAFVQTTADRPSLQKLIEGLFLTTDLTAAQNGLFDFDNVGFEGRDDSGEPLLSVERVYKLLERFASQGLQSATLSLFTNQPLMRALGAPQGTGVLSAFNTLEVGRRKRRQWRVQFTTSTTYAVYERIVGYSTSLTSTQLVDDRSPFPSTWTRPALLNPDVDQGSAFPVDLSASSASVAAINRSLAQGTLLQVGAKGSRYYVEFQADPSLGTADVLYTPTDCGISWTIASGVTPFSPGDQYLITANAGVDNILLLPDEIPTLAPADLTVTLRSAL